MIGQSLYAIIDLVLRLATLLFLLRFLLQAADADRFNPLSQAVVKGSDPFAQPLRKLLPNDWVVRALIDKTHHHHDQNRPPVELYPHQCSACCADRERLHNISVPQCDDINK